MRLILFLAFFIFGINLSAQINSRALYQIQNDSIQPPGITTDNNLDSLLFIWHVQQALKDSSMVFLYEEEDVPAANLPDSIYIRRLNNLPSVVSLPYNEIIRNHIVFYLQKIPHRLEIILGLSEYYLPLFEQILDVNNIPLEMRALPIIESALNPVAVSRVGATGMWQFMLHTGRQYGLTITSIVDERRDPIASGYAAAKFLNDLYAMYGDWTLVIAAYNCGPGNVNKAIKRADGKRDYWDIYPYLPKETRNYVPAFIAVNYALQYYKEHRLTPKKINIPTYIDTFMVNKMLHFSQISDVIGIPIDELRDLNPQYRKDIIPGVQRPFELRLPLEYTSAFIENEEIIFGHKEKEFFNKDIVVTPAGKDAPSIANVRTAQGRENMTYKVQKGESLNMIAQKHGVKLSDLRYWNNLKDNAIIHPGQSLIVHAKAASTTKNTNKKEDTSSTTAKKAETPKAETKKTEVKAPKTHIVKKGESLWEISQKYPSISFTDLLKANGMNSKSKIYAGQKLKLPN